MKKNTIVSIVCSAILLFQQATTLALPPAAEPAPLLPPGMPTPKKAVVTNVPKSSTLIVTAPKIVAVSPQVTITNLSKQSATITEITVNYMIVNKTKSNKETPLQSTKAKIHLTITPGDLNGSSFSPELHISTNANMDNASIHSWVSKIQIGSDKINIAKPSTFSGQSICITRSNNKWILAACAKKTNSKKKKGQSPSAAAPINVPVSASMQTPAKSSVLQK